MAKTGSTAIQMSLHGAQDLLLENGVLYPDGYMPPNAHHSLTGLFKPPQEVWPRLTRRFAGDHARLQARAREDLEIIRRQVERHRPQTLILSSEMFFSRVQEPQQEIFRDALRTLSDDIDICLYVRPPAALYLSTLQQCCKTEADLYLPRPLQIRGPVGILERVFGRQVIVRGFDPALLHGQDLVQDFAVKVAGLEAVAPRISSLRANESISAEAMAISAMNRQISLAGQDMVPMASHQVLLDSLAALDAEEGPRTRPQLRPGLAAAIERASTDLLWLRDRYGLEFPDVSYDAIDGTPLETFPPDTRVEDLCIVDPARRERMLYRLLQAGLEARAGQREIAAALPVQHILSARRMFHRLRRRLARRAPGL